MLYLLGVFTGQAQIFNLFRYITFRTGGAIMTAMFVVFLLGPWLIDALRVRQGKGQPIREDGPQSHLLTKKGTPTMGGLMILFGLCFATVLWANPYSPYVWIVLAVTLSYGLIGFYDDYLKVTKRNTKGFSGRTRLFLELFIAGLATYAISVAGAKPFATTLTFPFFKDAVLDLGPVLLFPRRSCHRGGGKRRQSHGRARRARDRAGHDRGIGVWRDRLSRGKQAFRRLLADTLCARRG